MLISTAPEKCIDLFMQVPQPGVNEPTWDFGSIVILSCLLPNEARFRYCYPE